MFDIFGPKDPAKALQRAHEYKKEGRVDTAIKVLENNLTEGEESFDLYMELARLYFETDQRSKAMELLRRARTIVPQRTDEIVALMSGLFYQRPSIDAGDFLLNVYVDKEEHEQIQKILKELSSRDITLLLTRYEKVKQAIESKNIIVKSDVFEMLILASLKFYVNESEKAVATLEPIMTLDIFSGQILRWARIVARERFNDPYAALVLLRCLSITKDFSGVLNQAQRMLEKFPSFTDPILEILESIKPPPDTEAMFAQLLTSFYIKKGELDKSIAHLQSLTTKDPKKIDDVIKGLRELERTNPKDVKVLYALGDTYLESGKISLAISSFDKILGIDQAQGDTVLHRYEKAFNKDPNNPLVIQAMVNLYIKNSDADAAVGIVERAYRSDPGLIDEYVMNLNTILDKHMDNTKALYLLGLCFAHKGDKESALVIFDNLLSNKQADTVLKAATEISEKYPEDLDYLSLRAKSLVFLGKEQEALSHLSTFLEHKPEDTITFLPILDLIVKQRPDLAKKIMPFYEKYRKVEPYFAELALARAYAFMGEYDKSVTSFKQCLTDGKQKDNTRKALVEVIKERPDAIPLLFTAARIFLKDGEVEIATQFFKTAQKVDPKAFFEIVDEFYDVIKAFPRDRGVRTLLIDTFFNRKLWARVIEEARHAIEVFGTDTQYFQIRLGQSLVENGSLSAAVRPLMLSLDGPDDYAKEVIDALDKILEIDKSNVPAHVARGRALSRAHRIEEAVEEYLLTVRIVPTRAEYVLQELNQLLLRAVANAQVVFAIGKVEVTLKHNDDAVKHLLQACELDPGYVKEVIPVLTKLSQETPSPLLDFALGKVNQLADLKSAAIKYYIKAQMQDKTFREPAISELKKICAEDPKDIESRKGIAQIYFDHNNLEDALDAVREVYRLDNREGAWAKNFISNVLQKNPQHMPSYYFLSHILLNEQNQKLAIEIYRKLMELAPTEVTKVVNDLERVKEKSSELTLYLATIYKNTGDVARAIKLFEGLFARDQSFGEAIAYHIKEILMKNADVPEGYVLASKIFAAQKEYGRAIEAIRRAKELVPDKEEIFIKEGQLYYEMGEADKAFKVYTELLGKSKDRKTIYRLINKTRKEYYREKIEMIKGTSDEDRLKRANFYLLIDKTSDAEKELQFEPQNKLLIKYYTILRVKVCLRKNRPLDALDIIQSLPVDHETAPIYADVYEAMGSFEAAATILRQAGIEGAERRIAGYEKLAQGRRLVSGMNLIEGRR